MSKTISKKEFIKAVSSSISISESLVRLGMSPKGGNFRYFKLKSNEWNVDTSHFTGMRCGKGGNKKKYPIEDYLSGKRYCSTHVLKKKLLSQGVFQHKCYNCGRTEWNNKPIPIELEHIDGDSNNNTLDNLTILCPNCHAQTPTYRGKNCKGKYKIPRPHCKDCEIELYLYNKSGYCHKCLPKQRRKIERPSKKKLLEELSKSNYVAVGKKYGVSDNTIRKWLK